MNTLGELSRFPREVRDMIYQEAINQRFAGRLAATNSHVYAELRQWYILTFDIDPTIEPSQVRVFNWKGEPWPSAGSSQPHFTIPTASYDVRDLMVAGPRFPFDKFNRIVIQIHAPAAEDPGQLIRALYSITRLLDYFLPEPKCNTGQSGSEVLPAHGNTTFHLPDITIRFLVTETKWWSETAGYSHSVVGPPSVSQAELGRTFDGSNLQILLIPFHRLRHARPLEVEFPSELQRHESPLLATMLRSMKESGRLQMLFGTNAQADDDSRLTEDFWHYWFEYILNNLSGRTAAQVRRERAYHWCSTNPHNNKSLIGHPSPEEAFVLPVRQTQIMQLWGFLAPRP
ncbi:hypothetical protein H2200_006239 [Cladophialophora chaetospira]|uniref:Uncharacterized protein n=1 Tax=Cladophialophora chaetospira TaxID=386627 RepID=A0AA38XB64_9EURO|nr:hypothetical protein H2200_006239 [Cladophialophora chaetospira]